jgi:hypothetical protein
MLTDTERETRRLTAIAMKREVLIAVRAKAAEIEAELAELENPTVRQGDEVQLTDTLTSFSEEDLNLVWTVSGKSMYEPLLVSLEVKADQRTGQRERSAFHVPISALRVVNGVEVAK